MQDRPHCGKAKPGTNHAKADEQGCRNRNSATVRRSGK